MIYLVKLIESGVRMSVKNTGDQIKCGSSFCALFKFSLGTPIVKAVLLTIYAISNFIVSSLLPPLLPPGTCLRGSTEIIS